LFEKWGDTIGFGKENGENGVGAFKRFAPGKNLKFVEKK
jgi:hypothetical protein